MLSLAACGGSGGGGGGASPVVTTDVTVGDGGNIFTPPDIQVSPGALVTWTWSSNRTHNVTFADNSITDSGDQGGGTYATTMPTTTGTYGYQCTIHSGMDGSVLVQ